MSLSHLVWEILNIFIHDQPDKKLRHFHVPGYMLGSLSIIAWISPNNSGVFFLLRIIWDAIISIKLIQLFSNLLHCPQIDTQTLWNLCIGSACMNAKQYSMLVSNFWKTELHHGAAFIHRHWSTNSNLLHSRHNPKQIKQMCEIIIQNGYNLPITFFMCHNREYSYIHRGK